MVYAIYIAAAAVIGLLIGFVALAVGWLRKTVLRNVRSKTVGLLSVYDELLEDRSRKLREMQEALEVSSEKPEASDRKQTEKRPAEETPVRTAAGTLGMAERAGAAVYRDRTVGGLYRMIRQNFSFRVEELLPGLDHMKAAGTGPAGRLLKELDWDTMYRLSTLSPEDQLAVLYGTLPAEGLELLKTYTGRNRQFGALAFYDHLRDLADAEPKPACLRVPADLASDVRYWGEVKIQPDEEICEGFQMEADNCLYDYCIKAREMS
ncbi:MAG: hypothetical protein KH452_13555 [Clostridiales bacterium]|nr:hypothetical protein [Clostridiales bacterium]